METIVSGKIYTPEDIKIVIRDKRLAFLQEFPMHSPHYVILADWQRRILSAQIDIYMVNEDGFLSYRIYDLIICVSPKIQTLEDIQVF